MKYPTFRKGKLINRCRFHRLTATSFRRPSPGSFVLSLSLYLSLIFSLFFTACPDNNNPAEKPNPYRIVQGGYPNWSPKGERLAFIRNDSLFLYYFEEEKAEFVTAKATEPSFAPDGLELVFERDQKLFTLNIETGAEKFIAEGITPSWSNNGKWIAFAHKAATRVLTDGTRVWGVPTPDSSLYYYDIESESIVRVIVENADSLWVGEELSWPGEKLSLSHPEWAVQDSILLFYSGRGMWKVRRWGGRAVRIWHDFGHGQRGKSTESTTELKIDFGQMDWSEFQERVAYFYVLDNRPFSGITKHINLSRLKVGLSIGISSGHTDPSWSPFGIKIAVRKEKDNWIWIFNFTHIDEIKKP